MNSELPESREREALAMLEAVFEAGRRGWIEGELALFVAEGVGRFLANFGAVSLDQAFDVGCDLLLRVRRRDRWRDALRELAEQLPAESVPKQAARISQRLVRYMSGPRWVRDRRAGAAAGDAFDVALFRVAQLAEQNGRGLSAKSIQRAIERTQLREPARDFRT
ncbi:MAG: hypothetical protein HY943_21140 [Gammaproteobacteria bacterium]|nr:hypothetical protein [Gammaproteobacteria bacterium]